ncbi:MAG TPA: BNR-4 repeat-containing protein [Bryobacteraceae bacterium]|nr:BNR-4 repeat-containing protein [Bryobacteraceae bacterium]
MAKSILLACFAAAALAASAADAGRKVVLNDDGGWCWFEDERVVVDRGKLIIGSVAMGTKDPARRGNIEVTVHDIASGVTSVHVLNRPASDVERKRWADDHNSPALVARPDGRILAMYAMHGPEEKIYYRVSGVHDAASWGEEKIFVPSPSSRVTYSNLHLLANENGGRGRIYDFFRGLNNSFKPSYAWSDDFGETWQAGNVFINVPARIRHRPYVKYASNARDTVHIAYTEGHPRNFDNSVYHVFYRDGELRRSDGTPIRAMPEGLKSPDEGTLVFRGDANNVAWTSDLHIDGQGRPYMAFSVQKDSGGLPDRQAGEDHRYRYARWTGKAWESEEIAYAGSKLYPGEDDYTGNVALDPHDPDTVYISTNADPVTGKALISRADGQRHWEIFKGRRRAARWTWTPVTRDSSMDNIRPIVPIWTGKQFALLWLRGKMRAYTDYAFEIVGYAAKR